MAQQIADATQVEAHDLSEWGAVGVQGVFRPLGEALGVSAFGLNQLELAPGAEGPEHDHRQDGQEEVYVVIRGDGKIRLDGTEHELSQGRYVFMAPETKRQMVAGAEGLVWAAIGCKPGAYSSQ